MAKKTRPETIDDAAQRTHLRDLERRICDLTAITVGARKNAKGGRVDDLKALVFERQDLRLHLSLAGVE